MAFSISTKAVSSMMKTCRILLAEGAKYLLMPGVQLDNEASIISFVSFLFRARRQHIRHLHKLTLGAPDGGLSNPTAHFFTSAIILLSPPIHYLSLLGEWDRILQTHPGISDAFVSLEFVRGISISGVGEHCLAMLRRMRSPVSTIYVGYNALHDEAVPPAPSALHPLAALPNFQGTLENFHLSGGLGESDLTVITIFPLTRFLHMTNIVIPIIRPFIAAFPNLAYLMADTAYDGSKAVIRDPIVVTAMTSWRTANQAAQDLHGSWKTLDHFEGTVHGLYVLGLRCRVNSLKITLSYESFDWLSDVLIDTRPSTVVLTISRLGTNALADDGLLRGLRLAAVSELTNLTVRLMLTKKDKHADLQMLLVCDRPPVVPPRLN